VLIGEAAWRAWRHQAPSRTSRTLETIVLIVILVTAAGGLGLLTGGGGPHDSLHLLYGVLALGVLPIAGRFSRNSGARRAGIATALAGVVVLVILLRLFQTG